jgi:hypothetical protein
MAKKKAQPKKVTNKPKTEPITNDLYMPFEQAMQTLANPKNKEEDGEKKAPRP